MFYNKIIVYFVTIILEALINILKKIIAKKVFTIIIFFACIATGSAQIEVHSSNQVGIGTTNPQYKQYVVGDAFVTGNFLLGTASTFLGTTSNYPLIF